MDCPGYDAARVLSYAQTSPSLVRRDYLTGGPFDVVGVLSIGKLDRRHVKRKTEAEVIRAVCELERNRHDGLVRTAGRVGPVEKWLTHWVENISAHSVRQTTVEEVVPFTVEESRRILDATAEMRNDAWFVVALTLGLRRGEVLGLTLSDIDIRWEHGCAKSSNCRTEPPQNCPLRRLAQATLTLRRAVQQYIWQHGCPSDNPCGHRYGANCRTVTAAE